MDFKHSLIVLSIALLSCNSTEKDKAQTYSRWVGDIAHDPEMDDEHFQPCHGDDLIFQYFNMRQGLQFEGEKIAIERYFAKNYQPVETDQSGWVRVRFIVNCEGETGRFRVLESDENYKERPFDKRISDQLLKLSKNLNGWKIQSKDNQPIDYYQYLLFKIKKGKIENVMP